MCVICMVHIGICAGRVGLSLLADKEKSHNICLFSDDQSSLLFFVCVCGGWVGCVCVGVCMFVFLLLLAMK